MILNKKTKQINNLKELQISMITDAYTVGVYNGLELALSVLEEREPDFKTVTEEPKVIEKENEKGRTLYSGIRRG